MYAYKRAVEVFYLPRCVSHPAPIAHFFGESTPSPRQSDAVEHCRQSGRSGEVAHHESQVRTGLTCEPPTRPKCILLWKTPERKWISIKKNIHLTLVWRVVTEYEWSPNVAKSSSNRFGGSPSPREGCEDGKVRTGDNSLSVLCSVVVDDV